jgi:hypothetical protein
MFVFAQQSGPANRFGATHQIFLDFGFVVPTIRFVHRNKQATQVSEFQSNRYSTQSNL